MVPSRRKSLWILMLAMMTAAGCGGDGTSRIATAPIEVRLTDAPISFADVQSVMVTLTGVIVFPGDTDSPMDDMMQPGPTRLMTIPATFDLLTLTDGATALLASGEVPVGPYNRIRMEISDATLVYMDGRTEPLKIESNKVDVPIRFEVLESAPNMVTLDFDAAASVHVNETGSEKFILRPVVTPVP